jgi:hypothetical protein
MAAAGILADFANITFFIADPTLDLPGIKTTFKITPQIIRYLIETAPPRGCTPYIYT